MFSPSTVNSTTDGYVSYFSKSLVNDTQHVGYTSESVEIEAILRLVIMPVFIVFGTIGNGLSFYIMKQGSMKKMSTCFYLSILALADTSVLWFAAFTTWIGHLTQWSIDLHAYTDCKLGYFMYHFGAHYSSMLLASMSIEKFFALYFPLKAKSYCTVGTAKWVTSILALVIAGFNVPTLIYHQYNGYYCVIIRYRSFIFIVDTVFYALIPIVIMFLANAAIIHKLMYIKYKGISHSNESVSKSSTRGSVMVVTISLAFLILTSPSAVYSAADLWHSTHPLVQLVVVYMIYLNHSINGILYCIFGQKFGKELLILINCCRNNGMRDSSSSTTMSSVHTVTGNSA